MENNGCSIPGCSQAPEDEPKMSVSPGESRRPVGTRPMQQPAFASRGSAPVTSVEDYRSKNRTLFMMLGLLLGPFGIHNFYAGYTIRGAMQLLLTCLTLFYGAFVAWPWAIVEILVVSRDGANRPME